MEDLCDEILDELTKLQATVQKNKHDHDTDEVLLSSVGLASSIVTVVSLLNPVAWPIAAASMAGTAVSGILPSY